MSWIFLLYWAQCTTVLSGSQHCTTDLNSISQAALWFTGHCLIAPSWSVSEIIMHNYKDLLAYTQVAGYSCFMNDLPSHCTIILDYCVLEWAQYILLFIFLSCACLWPWLPAVLDFCWLKVYIFKINLIYPLPVHASCLITLPMWQNAYIDR